MRTESPVQIKLADYQPFPFKITQVALRFELDPEATQVHTKMQVSRVGPGRLELDGVSLELKHIALNGAPLPADQYELTADQLILADTPDQFELETWVEINPQLNTELSGLYISGGRFCTQCEATGFRRITFWPDRPDVMSQFTVRVEAEAATYPILLSNGTPGETGPLEAGRHYAEWHDPHPKPSYLFALCAGDYDVHTDHFVSASGRRIELAVHADKGQGARSEWAMECLKASMRWDEQVFGREYDLGVFNIVAVRDFNFGAMENKGLNIFNSAYVLADEASATDADFEAIESIVGHEYFHNWTGNRITCRDWFQLCLKEGLTVYRDQEFSADMRSRAVQRIKDVIRLRARQFAEDAGPLAHPVRPDTYASIDNLYTATVYEKGAELIRMLKICIGAEAFADGIQLYFDRHDGEATTIEHFYACFEESSGQDLTEFRRWYSQPGTPEVTVDEKWDATNGVLTVQFTQNNPSTPHNAAPTPLPIPLKVALFSQAGQKIEEQLVHLNTAKQVWVIEALTERPLVSVNRGFSAPIRLTHEMTADQQLKLAAMDDDPFNQWQGLQTLLVKNLLALAYAETAAPDPDLVQALAQTVKRHQADPAFAALLLRLPDINELMLERTPAHPTQLAEARKQFQQALLAELADEIERILDAPSPTPFRPNAAQSGIRALRSSALHLLSSSSNPVHHKRLEAVYFAAENMTESLASLRAICATDSAAKETVLEDFYARWSSDPLVIDKWFAAQAVQGEAHNTKRLLEHPDFDYGNPNRVRALIGVFAMQNLAGFHAPDGAGYTLLSQVIQTVDPLNSALAARLLTAFEQWRNLDPIMQDQAETALKHLQDLSLSKPASDILMRTLG